MENFDLSQQLLALSGILFCIGVLGFLIRKNAIMLLMSVEIMLNAVNLSLITLAWKLQNIEGAIAVFFVIVIAAAESVVGLAIILRMYRIKRSTDADDFTLLRS
jgi:NADH-quinone oxidoreductase subunit K